MAKTVSAEELRDILDHLDNLPITDGRLVFKTIKGAHITATLNGTGEWNLAMSEDAPPVKRGPGRPPKSATTTGGRKPKVADLPKPDDEETPQKRGARTRAANRSASKTGSGGSIRERAEKVTQSGQDEPDDIHI